jgi:hypothetical protein
MPDKYEFDAVDSFGWGAIGDLRRVDVAVPPLPIPQSGGGSIRLLKNARDFQVEAQLMLHSIGMPYYHQQAAAGEAFYFHVEYCGEKATVEMDALTGKVLQSFGEMNTYNRASKWAKTVMSAWGELIYEHNKKQGLLDRRREQDSPAADEPGGGDNLPEMQRS